MKADIHPNYRKVVFHDTSVDAYFVIGSTIETSRTTEYEGETMPYVVLDTSSASHPVYTGKQAKVQAEGRIANFNRRFGSLTTKKA